jgi:hypothetical protein
MIVLACMVVGQRTFAAQPQVSSSIPAMELSQVCSESAAIVWRASGHDNPKPEPGREELRSYDSHYNRQLGRCLIATRVTIELPNGTATTFEQIADAVTPDRPLASMSSRNDRTLPAITRAGQRLPDSIDNHSWYARLMKD